MTRCPDFHLFGLQSNIFEPSDPQYANFLGEINEQITNLFLPDRKGFVYYNNALEDLHIIFDTGATVSVSPDLRDFLDYTKASSASISNITRNRTVLGQGTVAWKIYDDKGTQIDIKVQAYYVPTKKVRLFSVQDYLGRQSGTCYLEEEQANFSLSPTTMLTFNTFKTYTSKCQLPLAYLTQAIDAQTSTEKNQVYNVLANNSHNLSSAQKKLLGWHYNLGHFNIFWIHFLTKTLDSAHELFLTLKVKS